ncbi:hypothetical protein WK68_17160 [Burkholderia ubonensis]|uniref:autotransporter outer membrane beta-barrel domain-containing protein n=1 Tax=Burkholderia ubonensis TaxID=101571 RepID=UPI00075F6418|nr:autotransporter outer membrane beta-barrel domain-containing protein [Burkholderia ubonensis]KVU37420.1 hypothetical protein WK68_17160 [Burkholderia ubonensis]
MRAPWTGSCARANVLRAFGADDKTTSGGATTLGTHAGQIGAGLVAQFMKRGSVYATVSYLMNLDDEHWRTITGNVGVRWAW